MHQCTWMPYTPESHSSIQMLFNIFLLCTHCRMAGKETKENFHSGTYIPDTHIIPSQAICVALVPSHANKKTEKGYRLQARNLIYRIYTEMGNLYLPSRLVRCGKTVIVLSAANSWSRTGYDLAPHESLATQMKWFVLLARILACSNFLQKEKKFEPSMLPEVSFWCAHTHMLMMIYHCHCTYTVMILHLSGHHCQIGRIIFHISLH